MRKKLRQQSIRKKSLKLYSALVITLIIIAVALSYTLSTVKLKEEISNANINFIKQVNSNIDMVLKGVDKDTFNTIQQKEVVNFIDNNYENYDEMNLSNYKLVNNFNDIIGRNLNIDSIYAYSSLGEKSIYTNNGIEDINNFYDKEFINIYQNMNKTILWVPTRNVHKVYLGKEAETNLISIVMKYPYTGSAKRGAIAINIDLKVLENIIIKSEPKKLNKLYIVDDKNNIVLGDNVINSKENDKKIDISQLLNSIGQNNQGQIYEKFNGEEFMIFYTTSPYNNWKYINVIPNADINKPLTFIRNLLIIFVVILIAIGIVAIIFINLWTNKPVDNFIKSMALNLKTNDVEGEINAETYNLEYIQSAIGKIMLNHNRMESLVENNMKTIKWKMFFDLLMGTIKDIAEVDKIFAQTNTNLYSNNYIIMLLDIDNKNNIFKKYGEDGLLVYVYALKNISFELLEHQYKSIVQEVNNNVVVLISFESSDENNNMISALAIAENIRSLTEQYLKITVTLSLGGIYESILDISKSYNEALELVEYKTILGSNTIISKDDVTISNSKEFHCIFSMINMVVNSVKSANSSEVQCNLDKIFNEIKKNIYSPDIIRQLYIQLLIQTYKSIEEIGMDEDEFLDNNFKSPFDTLNDFETLQQIKSYTEELMQEIIEKIIHKRSSIVNSDLIDKMVKLIQENYMKYDMTLNYLAESFNLSVPYASKIFKEALETNFIDYLIAIRIEKAKGLLLETNIKIGYISEMVGYTRSNSFVRIFKKCTGKTPSEYRMENIIKSI